MMVNTSNCSFSTTPTYFTSVAGIDQVWNLAGFSCIYSATQTSFSVYPRHSVNPLGTTSAQLMTSATAYQWNLNWLGIIE